jgi:hypothetical protein
MNLSRIEAPFFCQALRSLVKFDLSMIQAVSGWPLTLVVQFRLKAISCGVGVETDDTLTGLGARG